MANDIKVNINVSDGGSFQQPIGNAKTLNKELEQAVANSGRVAAASKTMAAAKAAAVSPQESRNYAVERSIAGGTGAEGRDFAKQSQGLGGIVRLYATYAANLFAVGAAFQALNNAAQTTRLFESAQILGDRLGVSMKGLAQDIQSATGYAVSLQDALKFANLGSSVGLASKDIKELTVIAKGAANVLGRDSGDAINRIITGTAKQEQEILDELGIFLKANQAYEAYAKKQNITIRGTAAETLTAQQKVVAYAQEVAKAGQKYKEFATIDDPFAEFIAKGKEALQQVLEFVNKGIVPLIKVLNEASGAIVSLGGFLALTLVKRAVPELGGALNSLFTFDKKYAEAKGKEAIADLGRQYAAGNAKIKELEAQRAKILTPGQIVSKAIGDSADVRGGQRGISVTRVTTALAGTEANPKDLARLTQASLINKEIEKTIIAQLKGSEKSNEILNALINKGDLRIEAETKQIRLTTQGQKIGEKILADLRLNLSLEEQITAQKNQQANITKTIKEKGSNTAAAVSAATALPGAAPIDPIAAAMGSAALSANKATDAINKVGPAATKALGPLKSLGQGFAGASALAGVFTANMQGGTFSTLKGFLVSFKSIPTVFNLATAGLSGFSFATAAAGAGLNILKIATIGTIGVLGTLIGPILLLITAWQLFGDSIKNITDKLLNKFGLDLIDTEGKLDKLKEASDRNSESFGKFTEATALLNKEIAQGTTSFDEFYSQLVRGEKISGERLSSLEREIQAYKERKAIIEALKATGSTIPLDSTTGKVDYKSLAVQEAIFSEQKKHASEQEQVLLDGIIRTLRLRNELEKDTSKTIDQRAQEGEALLNAGEEYEAQLLRIREVTRSSKIIESDKYKASINSIKDIDLAISAFEKKTAPFKGLEKLIDPSINRIAGEITNNVASLGNVSVDSQVRVLGAANALAEYATRAQRVGANVTVLTGLINAMNAAAAGGAVPEAVTQAFRVLLEKQLPALLAQLASSPQNQAAKPKKEIQLIKLIEDNKISIFEKSVEEQLKIQKKLDDSQLASLESLGQNKITTEGTFLSQKLSLLQDSADKEISIAENAVTERAYLTNLAQTREAENYAKNLKLTKGNAEKRTEVEEKHTQEVININNAYLAFKEKYEDRIEVLETERIRRQDAEVNKLRGDTIALQKSYDEEEKAIARSQVLKEQNFEFEKSISTESERSQAIKKAGFEEQVRQEERVYKLKEEYVKLLKIETDLRNEELKKPVAFQNIELITAAEQKTKAYADQIDRINLGLPIAVQDAGDFAGRVFDFNEQKKFVDSISKVLEDALFNGGKGGAKKIRKLIQDELLKEFKISIIADIKGGVKGIVDAVTGVLSGKTTLTAGIEQFTKIATNLSSAFSNTLTTSFKSLATSDFGVKLGLADTTQTPVKLADGSYGFDQLSPLAKDISAGLGALGGALTSLGIKDLISGGYKTGIDPLVTGATAIAGALFPGVGSLIAGTIGGLVNRLFGRKLKDVGIEGTFGKDNTFKGDSYQFYKGGLFASNKTKRKALDPQLEAGLSDAFKGVKVQTALFATALGLSTDGILGYTKKIKFSTKGLSEDQINTKLQEEFGKIGEEMAKTLLVGTAYNKNQETAVQTLTRLANTLIGVNEVLDTLGIKAFKASLANADLASKLVDLAGGLDKFDSLTNTYYENFYTSQEKSVLQTKNLTRAFDALGKPVPKTRAEFRAMVEALDVTTQAGQQAFVGLLSLSDALNSILPPLSEVGTTAQDAIDKLKQTTDEALSAVERAIDSQKEYFSTLEQGAQDSVTKLGSLFDLLDRNVKELYKSVTSTAKLGLTQAKAFITNALNTAKRGGGLPDQAALTDAIGTVRDSLVSDNYKTRFEQERDTLTLANQLDALKGVTGDNLTTAEQQLANAKLQLKRLDEQLKAAKDQVDITRGIDVSIKSVAQAIADLTKALTAEKAATSTSKSAGSTATSGSDKFVVGGTDKNSSSSNEIFQLGVKTKAGNFTYEAISPAGTSIMEATGRRQDAAAKAAAIWAQIAGTGTIKSALETFKAAGLTLLDVGAGLGYKYSDLLSVATKEGVGRFATGGTHPGGIRLVGENGPELENTGPSNIASNSQTKKMLSNEDLIVEIEKLREDLRAQAAANLVLVQKTTKLFEKWDYDGMPAVRT